MPIELNQTVRTSFVKGLLTEYSELNFPEDASVDELNCDLKQAGNRTRRLGIEYETGYELSTDTFAEGFLYSTGTWYNVGDNSDLEYLVVQVGSLLKLYRKGAVPLSSGYVGQVNMFPFNRPGGLGAASSKVSLTSINGYLIVASPQINTFYVKSDLTTHQITFKVRDFAFYGAPEARTGAVNIPLSVGRQYDTFNCGWVGEKGSEALDDYIADQGQWPALTHPWYSGKNSSGDFSVSEWLKVYSGNTVTANGHFILNLFYPDRDGVSGLTDVRYWDNTEIDTPNGRFSAVAAYAGRVFYGGVGSNVYFSRILEDIRDIGNCYQVNDPTSEETPDLLDTDGGYVRIPEANGIKKLHSFGASLLVFADNGVWKISGVDDVFRATEYSVTKVTDFGLAQRDSFVAGSNNQPFWWSYIGIHTVVISEEGGVREVSLSKTTIQSFWNNISGDAKGFVTGEFDAINNRVLWLYPNNDEAVEYKLNNILFLDIDLQAFYPWKISDKATNTPYVLGTSFFSGSGSRELLFNVTDDEGNFVVDKNGDEVVVSRSAGVIDESEIYFVVRDPSGSLTFAKATNVDFVDWGTEDYSTYAESAYNFIGDLARRKTSPYITILLRRTETGWRAIDSGYEPIRGSSLLVSAYWDFKTVSATSAQEAYRYKMPLVVDDTDLGTFSYPNSVITTRLKLRGRGRTVRLRFEASPGKDFNLLGWETLDSRKTTY